MAEVGVGQVEGESRVVAPGRRSQQQRAVSRQAQLQAGQMARAPVIDPLLAQALRTDVAVPIEDGEGLAMLEDLVVGIGQLRSSLDVIAGIDLPERGRLGAWRVSREQSPRAMGGGVHQRQSATRDDAGVASSRSVVAFGRPLRTS
jgi:hypothetical protein